MSERPPSSRTVFRASPLQELRAAQTAIPSPDGPADYASPLNIVARDDIPSPPRSANPRNPLMTAAESLLVLLASIRAGRARMDLPRLHGVVSNAITQFGEAVRGICPDEHVKRSAYALCATTDDIVLNLPGQPEQAAEWARRSMVVRSFGESIGGDRFWTLLDQMIDRPAEYGPVIEVFHACMAAGFLGRFRVAPNGKSDHQATMQRAYQALEHPRRVSPTDLSPQWRGVLAEMSSLRFWTPLSLAAGAAALLLLVAYIGLRIELARAAVPVHAALASIYDQNALHLARDAAAPPAPAPSTELERIEKFLAPEIARNQVTVGEDSAKIRIRSTSPSLFDPGSASLRADDSPLFARVAGALDREAGAINVEGHTDNTPVAVSATYPDNMALSKARAETVAKLLRQRLIDPARVTANGFGDTEPVASNTSMAGKALNRRVEVVIERSGR